MSQFAVRSNNATYVLAVSAVFELLILHCQRRNDADVRTSTYLLLKAVIPITRRRGWRCGNKTGADTKNQH